MSDGPVHFILTAGELVPRYAEGLASARVHGAEVWLWHVDKEPPDLDRAAADLAAAAAGRCAGADAAESGDEAAEQAEALGQVRLQRLQRPSWLEEEDPSHQADPLLLKVLYEHGGLFLGLDTLSLRPALDLLTRELCVSLDVPWADYANGERRIDHPFSMHLLAEQGSQLVADLYAEAKKRITTWPPSQKTWGYTGPAILTDLVLANRERVDIPPFPTLCGFEGSYIWQWYLGLAAPPPETRVLHLFSSAYPELWRGDRELWLSRNPGFRQYAA